MGAVSISRFAGVALSLLLLWRIVFVNAVVNPNRKVNQYADALMV